jgi:hypothetical protein
VTFAAHRILIFNFDQFGDRMLAVAVTPHGTRSLAATIFPPTTKTR